MAETLEVSQLLANSYEPKRVFEWIMEIDGIDAFTAKTFARPKLQREHITIDYINQKRFLAGKGEWQPLTLEIYDPIEPSAAQKVMDWLYLVHDDTVGRMGYSAMYKKNISLKMLDPIGNVVEKWNLIGVWPQNPDFKDLDMASSDALTVAVELRMDSARLEF